MEQSVSMGDVLAAVDAVQVRGKQLLSEVKRLSDQNKESIKKVHRLLAQHAEEVSAMPKQKRSLDIGPARTGLAEVKPVLAGVSVGAKTVMLVGPAGAGKTTLSQALVSKWLAEGHTARWLEQDQFSGFTAKQQYLRAIVDTQVDRLVLAKCHHDAAIRSETLAALPTGALVVVLQHPEGRDAMMSLCHTRISRRRDHVNIKTPEQVDKAMSFFRSAYTEPTPEENLQSLCIDMTRSVEDNVMLVLQALEKFSSTQLSTLGKRKSPPGTDEGQEYLVAVRKAAAEHSLRFRQILPRLAQNE